MHLDIPNYLSILYCSPTERQARVLRKCIVGWLQLLSVFTRLTTIAISICSSPIIYTPDVKLQFVTSLRNFTLNRFNGKKIAVQFCKSTLTPAHQYIYQRTWTNPPRFKKMDVCPIGRLVLLVVV